jgi:hypothetical protein
MALQRIEPRTKQKQLHKCKVQNHYTNQALKEQQTVCMLRVLQATAIKCAEIRRHQISAFGLPRCGGKSGVIRSGDNREWPSASSAVHVTRNCVGSFASVPIIK